MGCDYEIEQQVHLVEKNPLDTSCQILITRMCVCVCVCVFVSVCIFFNREGVFRLQDLWDITEGHRLAILCCEYSAGNVITT